MHNDSIINSPFVAEEEVEVEVEEELAVEARRRYYNISKSTKLILNSHKTVSSSQLTIICIGGGGGGGGIC